MVEQPFTAIAGHPYLAGHTAALAVFNRVGSGKKVRVMEVNFDKFNKNSGSLIGTLSVDMTVEASESTVIDYGTEATIQKMDSNNASVPSQLKAYLSPNITFSSSGIEFFNPWYQNNFNPVNALQLSRTMSLGKLFDWSDDAVPETQKIIVRAGEGIRIHRPNDNMPAEFEISIHFNIGSASYVVNETVRWKASTGGSNTVLYLRNGTGSGVTIEVSEIAVRDVGTVGGVGVLSPVYSIEPIAMLDPSASMLLTPMKLDSANPSLVGIVDVAEEARVHLRGESFSFIEQSWLLRQVMEPSVKMNNVGNTYIGGSTVWGGQKKFLPELDGIVLNPGEGLAVFRRGAGNQLGDIDIKMEFVVTDILSGGGEYGYAF
jgi:hypothetical protein